MQNIKVSLTKLGNLLKKKPKISIERTNIKIQQIYFQKIYSQIKKYINIFPMSPETLQRSAKFEANLFFKDPLDARNAQVFSSFYSLIALPTKHLWSHETTS